MLRLDILWPWFSSYSLALVVDLALPGLKLGSCRACQYWCGGMEALVPMSSPAGLRFCNSPSCKSTEAPLLMGSNLLPKGQCRYDLKQSKLRQELDKRNTQTPLSPFSSRNCSESCFSLWASEIVHKIHWAHTGVCVSYSRSLVETVVSSGRQPVFLPYFPALLSFVLYNLLWDILSLSLSHILCLRLFPGESENRALCPFLGILSGPAFPGALMGKCRVKGLLGAMKSHFDISVSFPLQTSYLPELSQGNRRLKERNSSSFGNNK